MSREENDTPVFSFPERHAQLKRGRVKTSGRGSTSALGRVLGDDDKRLEAALAITELANSNNPLQEKKAEKPASQGSDHEGTGTKTTYNLIKDLFTPTPPDSNTMVQVPMTVESASGASDASNSLTYVRTMLKNADLSPMPSLKPKRKRRQKTDSETQSPQPATTSRPPPRRKPTLREMLLHKKAQKEAQEASGNADSSSHLVIEYVTDDSGVPVVGNEEEVEELEVFVVHSSDDPSSSTWNSPLVIDQEALQSLISHKESASSSSLLPPKVNQPCKMKTHEVSGKKVTDTSNIILPSPAEKQVIPSRILPEIPKVLPVKQTPSNSAEEAKKINLTMRSLKAVQSIYRSSAQPTASTATVKCSSSLQSSPSTTSSPILPRKRTTALGSVMSEIREVNRPCPAKSPGSVVVKSPIASKQSAAADTGNSPEQPSASEGSADKQPFIRHTAMSLALAKVQAESSNNSSSSSNKTPSSAPSTPTAADISKLPPKKRRLFEQMPPFSAAEPDNNEQNDSQPASPAASSSPKIESAATGKPRTIDPKRNLIMLQECSMAVRPDNDGDLPLHIAVAKGDSQLVGRLIHIMSLLKVNLDTYNGIWQTPLHLAAIVSNVHILRKLLLCKANPNKRDRNGDNVLHLCIKHADHECLSGLLQEKTEVDVNARNYDGLTPLHLAVMKNDILGAKKLLISHADVNIVDGKSGCSPLYMACEMKNEEMVTMLINFNANLNLMNYAGVLPVQIALANSATTIISLLNRYGADLSSIPSLPPEVNNARYKSMIKKSLVSSINEKQKSSRKRKKSSPDDTPVVAFISHTKRAKADKPTPEAIIEGIKHHLAKLNETDPHYKVLQSCLEKYMKSRGGTPHSDDAVPVVENELSSEGEEESLPVVQLPSVRTSLRHREKRKETAKAT